MPQMREYNKSLDMKTEDNNKTSQDKKTVKVDFTKKPQAQEKSTKSQDLLATLLGMSAEDGEKKPKKRPYLLFKEFGLVIPFWAIVSVEKKEEMVRKSNGHLEWVYAIVLNMGIESSPNMPFGEHTLYYNNLETREVKFNALIKTLGEHNYELNEI